MFNNNNIEFGVEMSNQHSIEVLNNGNSVGLILLMYNDKQIYTSDLRKVGGGYDRLKRVAEDLRDAGLVSIVTIEKPYLAFVYSLTDKGMKVAEQLLEIDKIIKE